MNRFFLVLPLLALAGQASGQIPFRVDTTRATVLERVTRDRWVHEGQHPGFVPTRSGRDAIHLRRMDGSRGWRRLALRLRGLEATLTLDSANRVTHAMVAPPPIQYSRYDTPDDGRQARRRLASGEGVAMTLPYAHFWDVPFILPPHPLTPGTTWSDTLSLFDGPGEGLTQRLDGVWRKRVVGDTLLGERRLPVVRVEADVRYRTTEVASDEALVGNFTISRDLSGTVTGFAVVDTALGVRAGGADTASWSGTAWLGTQDGRSFLSGVRYERTRTWALRDSAEWADSVATHRERQGGGMIIFPTSQLQERLVAGDSILADSLVALWRDTDDADERFEVERVLAAWWTRGRGGADALRSELTRLRRVAGDSTAGLFDFDPTRRSGPLTLDEVERALPYLDDPGRSWRVGVVPTWTYTQLAGLLLRATPILQPDSTAWPCVPDACRRLRSLLETASEPRLRDAALVGRFARDPARWTDRVRARADSGSQSMRAALLLADGVGATWPAAPKDPMPAEGADWRAWLSWLGGTVRFGDSHREALRMYSARTGRDPVEELKRSSASAAEDSAGLVYGTILSGMGVEEAPTPEALAAGFLSGSSARIALATRALRPLLAQAGLADPGIAAELVSTMLDSILAGGDSPWPAVSGLEVPAGDRLLSHFATGFHGVTGVPRFVLEESLPEGLASRFLPSVQPVDSATWAARPPRAGAALLRFRPVRATGDFVELSWYWTVRSDRTPDQQPEGYAGGGGLTLLRTPEGWRVVSRDAWIT